MSQQNALFWALLVILSFPLLIIWTFLGWILTSSPRICAVVAIILVTYTTGIASLYSWDQYLFLQYLCFLILFIFCFVYRSTTRIFRLSFLSFLILIQLSLHFLLLTNHEFSYRILLASWVSLLSSCNIVIVLLNLWLPVSEVNFLRDEGRFLESRCDRKLVRMLIASLGTIEVTDESSNGNDAAIIQKSKPILVLLHGYGGCNAQWVDCLAKLQSRFQVYCVELYGFGRSSRVPWGKRWEAGSLENTLDQMTDALEQWRETLLISEFILVTHSLSCYVGIAYLLKYPGHISQLYLTSPIGLHTTFSTHSPLPERSNHVNSWGSPQSDNTDLSLHSLTSQMTSSTPFGISSIFSCFSCEIKPLSHILWECNFTPMDFLRWLGPIGPYCFSKFLSWYKTQLLQTSALRNYTSEQFEYFSRCYYQALASPAFGERSLSSFMTVHGHMHMSLVSLIETLTMPSNASLHSYGTFHENFSEKLINLKIVVLIWGEEDRIRSGTPNRIPPNNNETGHSKKRKYSKASNLDWMSDHLQESEFMTYLQVNGINCEGYEVQHAGHLIHFDNPEDLCDIIIQSYENSLEG